MTAPHLRRRQRLDVPSVLRVLSRALSLDTTAVASSRRGLLRWLECAGHGARGGHPESGWRATMLPYRARLGRGTTRETVVDAQGRWLMRLALSSDIHGNPRALDAVLADSGRLGEVDAY